VIMHRDDLLTQIRIRARLYGRNHARRVVQAVMHALRKFLPETAYHGLAVQLPADVGVTSPDRRHASHSPTVETSASHQFIRDIADELHVTGPDAAFYTRITFEQLNAFCRGITPAQLAESLPADLRPLLSARADAVAHRHRLMRLLGSAVTTLSLKPPATSRNAADTTPHSAVASPRTDSIDKQTRHQTT
jgi:uncharacterized protein (DUF2267 family)